MTVSPDEYGSLRIHAYCTCGGKLDASSTPPAAAREVHRLFRVIHSGPGHAPCDAATARKKRAAPKDGP